MFLFQEAQIFHDGYLGDGNFQIEVTRLTYFNARMRLKRH